MIVRILLRRPLGSELNSSHILDANQRSIDARPHYDVFEIFLRHQPALSSDRIGKILTFGNRFRIDLARRVHRILRVNRGHDFRNRDVELRQFVGINPNAHRVLPGTENGHAGNPWNPGERVVEVDVGVVGQKC